MVCAALLAPVTAKADSGPAPATGSVEAIVTAAIAPVMRQYGIPGMAVGIVFQGHIYVCDYGVASLATGRKVNGDTLFEIGSISKTFNATLGTYAEAKGAVKFSEMATETLPALRGSAFDHISLLELGTYTPGGLPLQVPDEINNSAQLMAWLKSWTPSYRPGTVRVYSNMSIGLFGLITATAMKTDYTALIQNQLFPALGLNHSFMTIPAWEAANYAQGYRTDGKPIRMSEDVLGPEAYGIRTTAGDMARFLAINMAIFPIDPAWQQAVIATHAGYDQLQPGRMVQDLGWEQYDLPVDLAKLEAGNDPQMLAPHPVIAFAPPAPPRSDVLINKTGSTGGFSAYVAYIPSDRIGIVVLANRSYPIPARVEAGYAILKKMDPGAFND